MKKLIKVIILISMAHLVYGQAPSYVNFEWDIIGLGFSLPTSGEDISAGPSFNGEIRYNLTDDYSIGIGNITSVLSTDLTDGTEVGVSSSWMLNVDKYHKTDSPNRFFSGAGLGLIRSGTVEVGGTTTVDAISSFGGNIRTGYELNHVRFSLSYHYAFKSTVPNLVNLGVSLTLWGGYKG